MNVPCRLHAIDNHGRYVGTLHVLGWRHDGAMTYLVRWAGQSRRWEIPECELERMVEPTRGRA